MKKLMTALLLGLALAGLAACTDAERSAITALGDSSSITCYSGGQVVAEFQSTGKVAQADTGDGLGFRDAATGKYVRVYADCIVSQN